MRVIVCNEEKKMSTNMEIQKDIINRLNRIEGQIRGIKKVIEENRDCSDILIQFSATRTALKKAGNIVIKGYCKECLSKLDKEKQDDAFNSLIEVLDKLQEE
jgi:DNA-binding FrmR family transcriptional regulator